MRDASTAEAAAARFGARQLEATALGRPAALGRFEPPPPAPPLVRVSVAAAALLLGLGEPLELGLGLLQPRLVLLLPRGELPLQRLELLHRLGAARRRRPNHLDHRARGVLRRLRLRLDLPGQLLVYRLLQCRRLLGSVELDDGDGGRLGTALLVPRR